MCGNAPQRRPRPPQVRTRYACSAELFARANQNCGSGIRYVFSLWASPWVTRTRGCPRPDVSRIRLPPIASSAPRSFAWLTCCPPSGAPGRRSPGNTMRRRFPPRGALAALPLLLLLSLPLASSDDSLPPPPSSSSSARARERHREARAKLERAPSRTSSPLAPATTASIPARRCTPSRPAASAPSATPTRATSRSSVGSSSHPRGRRVGPPRARARGRPAQAPRGVGPRPRTRHHPSRRGWRDFDARSTHEMSLHRLRASRRHRAGARGDIVAARHRRGGRRAPSPPRAVRPGRGIAVVAVRQHPSRGRGLARDVGAEGSWRSSRGPTSSDFATRCCERGPNRGTRSSPRSPSGIPSSSPNNTFARRDGCGPCPRCGLGRRTCPRGTDEPSSRWFRCSTCSITDTVAGTGRPARQRSRRDGIQPPVRSWCGPRTGSPGRDTRRGSTTAINPRSTRSCSTVSCR